MTKLIDLAGQKFGRLTVIKYIGNGKWLCKCECGNECIVLSYNLKNGNTKSCGCLQKENRILSYQKMIDKNFKNPPRLKHGLYKTRIFRIWQNIKSRCKDSKNKNYGARNIKVCDEWKKDFMNFYNWSMDNGYNENLSIDRIDVNNNYSPTNCRWVNQKTQQNNRRNNHLITYNNETHTIAEWSEILNISSSCINNRLRRGWSVEETLKPF